MTGPEHYRVAERLLANRRGSDISADVLAEAQVHATLALAAATALNSGNGQPAADWDEWRLCASMTARARA